MDALNSTMDALKTWKVWWTDKAIGMSAGKVQKGRRNIDALTERALTSLRVTDEQPFS